MTRHKESNHIWDEYDDYEESFVPKGGGGKKRRSGTSKTSRTAREISRENALEKRIEEAREKITDVIQAFPKSDSEDEQRRLFERYTSWLNPALHDGEVLYDSDTRLEFLRSKVKAGGQNVNKVSSAVRLTHIPTGIAVRSDESRDQFHNREAAWGQLRERLVGHIADWQILNAERKEIDANYILNLSLSPYEHSL